MDFTIKEIPEDDKPVSSGFWYDLDSGECEKFITCLKSEETQEKCREAISILSKLERAIDDITIWM